MPQLVEIQVGEDGPWIAVETDEIAEPRGTTRRGVRGESESFARAGRTFADAVDHLKPGVVVLIEKLRSMAPAMSDVELTFGIKVTAEAGVVLARAGTEANFEVKISYKATPPGADGERSAAGNE